MTDEPLLIDLYELTMAHAHWRAGRNGTASFSLFVRGYPHSRAYYVASGVDSSLEYLEGFGFSAGDIDALRSLERFDEEFLAFLSGVQFSGNVRSVAEGTVLFADEPILEVDAPIIEGQLVETALLNIVTAHTNLAGKAARIVSAAEGRPVVDFSARRTHGPDAAFIAARNSWIGGFAGTSHVGAAAALGIPAVGTMAHSFVQSYESELAAFHAYADVYPDSSVLLVDTWDVETGVANAITVAKQMEADGSRLTGIRIDSGDLAGLSRMARTELDSARLEYVKIAVSGGLDEFKIRELVASGAPIDSFGVGSAFGVAQDAPHIDSAYKLVEYEGRPVSKSSSGKQTLPGRKQVWRETGPDGIYQSDAITFADEKLPDDGTPLLRTSMSSGRRTDGDTNSLSAARTTCREHLERLPAEFLSLEPESHYEVRILGALSDYSVSRDLPRRSSQRPRPPSA